LLKEVASLSTISFPTPCDVAGLADAVCQTRNITKKHCEERSDEAAVKQTIKKLALHNKDEIITRGATFFE